MEAASLLGMLGILSIEDVKKKTIRKNEVLIFGIIGLILHMIFRRITIQNLLGGLSVGLVLILISFLSGERIGLGDGILFLLTGIFLGFWQNLILLWGAVCLMGVFAMVMLLGGRMKKNERIPFVPFVLIGYVVMLAMKGGGLVG